MIKDVVVLDAGAMGKGVFALGLTRPDDRRRDALRRVGVEAEALCSRNVELEYVARGERGTTEIHRH